MLYPSHLSRAYLLIAFLWGFGVLNETKMKAKDKLQEIMNGDDFYFQFTRVGIYKNGKLILTLTNDNCEDATTIFRRSAVFSQLDFGDTMEYIQRCGVFIGMYSGFDLLLSSEGWFLNTNEPNQYSICYNVFAGGIDKLVLVVEEDKVRLQITSNSYIIILADAINFH